MDEQNYRYDEIAEKVFYPIFDVIAENIITTTGITRGRMLDIGTGGGHLGFAMMKRTELSCVFADIEPVALKIAERRAAELGMSERCSTSIQDVHTMNLPDCYADLIVSRGSMIFWEDQEKAFSEIYRVLAPGGMTYVGTGCGSAECLKQINAKHPDGPDWLRRIREKSKTLTTEEYRRTFNRLGYEHLIIEGDGIGRWILLKK
jgi:ubiquinone/menaquinone biosynthesis C-methylase UbiE